MLPVVSWFWRWSGFLEYFLHNDDEQVGLYDRSF